MWEDRAHVKTEAEREATMVGAGSLQYAIYFPSFLWFHCLSWCGWISEFASLGSAKVQRTPPTRIINHILDEQNKAQGLGR